MKTSVIQLFLLSIYTALAPIHMTMFLVFMAVIADTIMGRWAATQDAIKKDINPRILVTSRKTRVGLVSKLLVYESLILMLFGIDTLFLNDLFLWFLPGFPVPFFLTKILGLLLILVEFDSIDEKIFRVKGVTIRAMLLKQLQGLKSVYGEVKKIKDGTAGPNTTTSDSTGTSPNNDPTN